MFTKNFVAGFLVAAVIIFVWVYKDSLSRYINAFMRSVDETASSTQSERTATSVPEVQVEPESPTDDVASESIPARSLPMSDTQKQMAENFGIDIDALVITPAMQACAKNKLGAQRYDEILSGSSPGPLEVVQLGVCISSTPQ